MHTREENERERKRKTTATGEKEKRAAKGEYHGYTQTTLPAKQRQPCIWKGEFDWPANRLAGAARSEGSEDIRSHRAVLARTPIDGRCLTCPYIHGTITLARRDGRRRHMGSHSSRAAQQHEVAASSGGAHRLCAGSG